MLLIEPTDVELCLAQQHLLKRVNTRLNQKLVDTPIAIQESGIPISITELRAHIRRYQNQDNDEYEQVSERSPADHSSVTSETAGTTDESLPNFTTGTVEAVERVRTVRAHTKLEFDVRLASGHKTTVTATNPETVTTESPVTRLLEDRNLVTVDDLVSQEITLERSGTLNNHYILSIPTDARFISPWWIYGMIACLVGQIPFFFLQLQSWIGVAGVTYVLLPIFTCLDTRYVRAESTWNPGLSRSNVMTDPWWPRWADWSFFMLIPWINVLLGLVYFYKRWLAVFRP